MTFPMLAGCLVVVGVAHAAPLQPGALQAAAPPAQSQSAGRPAQGKAGAAQGMPREADAYYQFLLGRHLESEGDISGAMAAYKEAARLDPKSAEVLAELASLHARENRFAEATATAESALKLDARNVSANRLLGFIHAVLARADEDVAPFDAGSGADAAKAAAYFEAARQGLEIPDPAVEMLLGRIYLRSGAYDKAAALFGRLVVDQPGQPEPVNLLVQAYLKAGRTDEATRLLEGAVAVQPQYYALLGEIHERQRHWAAAAEAYERAVARAPKNLELRTRLAVVLLSEGGDAQEGRALEILQQLRRESPADRRILYLLAQAQRETGRLDDSEATARQLMAIAPGSPTGAYLVALVLGQKQQYRAIVETLEPIVGTPASTSGAAGGDLLPALMQLGFAYLELGEADRALSTFERARALSPGDAAIDVYVIEAQLSARRYAEAVALARTARGRQPGNPHIVRLEAEALRQAGRGDEGTRLLTDALAEHPNDVSRYTALAEFEAVRGRYDAALAVIAQGAEKFPADVSLSFVAGSVYERQKRFADAERKFRDVLAKDPRHAPTLNYLGYMLADRGERLEEAVGYIKRALAVEPYSGAYLDSLGWAYFRQNKLDLAEEYLARAAAQRVRDSAAQDHFGDLLSKLGRYEEAVSAWQRALDGDGEQVERAAVEKKIRSAREKVRKD